MSTGVALAAVLAYRPTHVFGACRLATELQVWRWRLVQDSHESESENVENVEKAEE